MEFVDYVLHFKKHWWPYAISFGVSASAIGAVIFLKRLGILYQLFHKVVNLFHNLNFYVI